MSSNTNNTNVVIKTASSTPDSVTKKKLRELLKGVVAYVDVRLEKKDASDCVADEMTKLGATVVEYFVPEVTHLVFFEGYRRSYKTALRRKIHIVAPHWISDSKANLCKQNEEKYVPAMPPPKEEIPFFRKRMFKPMVDQIVAGTYIKADDRDANYYAEKLMESLNKKLKSRISRENGTPKNGSTPRTGGTGRRKGRQTTMDDFDTSNSEPIGQLIAETLKKFQDSNRDEYNIWIDSPATTVDEDNEDGYIPLFERCKARLLAEHKFKPPSERSASVDAGKDAPKTSEPLTSRPPEKATQETEVLRATSSYNNTSNTNVTKESQKSLKRRASVGPRPSKRIKLDLTSVSDKPTEKRGRGRPRKLQLLTAAPSESSSDSELGTSMISQPSDGSFQEISANMNSSINNSTSEILPSVRSLSLDQKIPRGRKSLAGLKVSNESTPIGRNTSRGLQTPSKQPTRRSNRLSMRVQISLDKFLVPRDQIVEQSSKSNAGISSEPSASGQEKPTNSDEGSLEMTNENMFLSLTPPEKLTATNLHQW